MPFSACSCLRRAAPGVRGHAKQPSSGLVWHGGALLSLLVEQMLLFSWEWVLRGGPAGHRGATGVLAAVLTAVKISSCISIACLWR